ncbi:MAG: hypothetical protein V5A55_09950 [Halovenus sp.]
MKMKDIDHTNPHTDEPFGPTYHNRRAVAADGGQDTRDEQMKDIEHEPPNDGPKRAFERGTEGRDETV